MNSPCVSLPSFLILLPPPCLPTTAATLWTTRTREVRHILTMRHGTAVNLVWLKTIMVALLLIPIHSKAFRALSVILLRSNTTPQTKSHTVGQPPRRDPVIKPRTTRFRFRADRCLSNTSQLSLKPPVFLSQRQWLRRPPTRFSNTAAACLILIHNTRATHRRPVACREDQRLLTASSVITSIMQS